MHVSAKVDYALRAAVQLAAEQAGDDRLLTADQIAELQQIPRPFLASILQELRRAGLIASKRGAVGGHRLARPATQIALADIIRAVDGPMAAIAGVAPEAVAYDGAAVHLREVWIAVRASLRTVLEATTLADALSGELPGAVRALAATPDAWTRR